MQHAAQGRRAASGRTSPTTSTSPSGARRARTAPATSSKGRPVAIDGRLEWREYRDQDGQSARQSISSPIPCSSSAGVTTPAPGTGSPGSRRDVAGGERRPDRRSGLPVRTRQRPLHRRRRHPVLGTADDFRRGKAEWQSNAGAPRGGVTRRAVRAPAGASRARTARTRSSRSTTRTSARCGSSSPNGARSARAASPARAAGTRARSPAPSSARASWRCCRTSPSRRTSARRRSSRPRPRSRGPVAPCRRRSSRRTSRSSASAAPSSTSRPGYLRNYLIPRKLAAAGDQGRARSRRSSARPPPSAPRARRRARAQENAALLSKTVLTIAQQAGDDGRLFGSVTAQDIADAIREARGIKVDKRKIHLEEPIRHIGTHMVVVEVDDGVTATVKTMVVEQK